MPSAAALVRGNEVRIGGSRVGTVDSITAKRQDDGTSVAILGLKLERDQMPLPKDSTLLIRSKSALGLKYVELTRGRSDEGFGDGDTIPLTAATPAPVEFDEFVNMFDDKTRAAMTTNLDGFGDAFAGRGASLNQAIAAFRPLLTRHHPRRAEPVGPEHEPQALHRHARRHRRRGRAGRRGAGAAVREPRHDDGGAARGRAPLHPGLDHQGPPVARRGDPVASRSCARSCANSEGLFRELRPGVRALRTSAPVLADALEIGTPTLRRSVALNRRLEPLLRELQAFAEDPQVKLRHRRPDRRGPHAEPDAAVPRARSQLQCNYITLWFRNVSSLLSEGDKNGTWQRFIIIATPQGPNNEGGPSSAPADGPTVDNHLHTNPYPNTASPGQPKECEAGNEPYARGKTVIGNIPGHPVRHDREGDALMARGAVKRRTPRSPVAIGLIALVIILIGTFLGFTKDIPFTTPFQVKATFESANSIRPGSPVRIAGVNVGKVKKVEATEDADTSVVTLQLNKQALPLHEDATAKIRPRIFLEGNFFVDLRPGTPDAPVLDDGGMIKVTHTASPVQLDEVLTSLQSDTRQDLKDVLDGLATALNKKPTAADDKDAATVRARRDRARSPSTTPTSTSPPPSARPRRCFEAFLGQEPGQDLSRLIDGTARTAGALIRHEEQLKDLITNFNRTTAAFASESDNLQHVDPRCWRRRSRPPTARSRRSTPRSRRRARSPARSCPASARRPPRSRRRSRGSRRRASSSPSRSSAALVKELSPATRDLARLTDSAIDLLPRDHADVALRAPGAAARPATS